MIALAVALAYPTYATFARDIANAARHVIADGAATEKSKPDRDCRKRAEGQRTPAGKVCTDGGERIPQDRRSPLDSLPPLAPLVA